MPTFSRTTCNGVTAEPEAGSRHTRVERRATERKAGATDSIRETHQLFGHSLATCAKSTSVYPALYPLTVSDTTGAEDWVRRERRGEGWWISSGGSCRDKRASTEVAKKSSKQCKPGKSLISRKETRKQTGNERRERKKNTDRTFCSFPRSTKPPLSYKRNDFNWMTVIVRQTSLRRRGFSSGSFKFIHCPPVLRQQIYLCLPTRCFVDVKNSTAGGEATLDCPRGDKSEQWGKSRLNSLISYSISYGRDIRNL